MLTDLNLLQTASAMARHAAARQELVAENVANADTPGFKAKDIEPFSEAFARKGAAAGESRRAPFRTERIEQAGTASPNGNTVSIEDQIWRATAAKRQHETAVTLYAKTLSLLRSALGAR